MPDKGSMVNIGVGKRSTGISGLDFQLGGGIMKGKSILLCAGPLSGAELIAEQFFRSSEDVESSYIMIDGPVSEGMTDASEMSSEEISEAMTGERIVIDSISSVIVKSGIDSALSIMKRASVVNETNDVNTLYIMYNDLHSAYDEMRLIRNSDIIISLNEFMHGNEIERNLTINKIPGADVPGRVFPYNIMENGIELSTTARVV
ncbi:RAD55 family ATPase [Methanoplanus endosymbiosus]|uniref:KaiC-like domain-containing protein n=1 Tax=Methanoplanus endosymbiosus TaxID=33865 RepID=A0A9E7TKH5_9EURY|nr:ATPase domain-containing protein [Methanoplanus endosymbiosus]UUX92729.1 hypothetical protein L6E24_00965 [Methanoplanus endosymbiosus]